MTKSWQLYLGLRFFNKNHHCVYYFFLKTHYQKKQLSHPRRKWLEKTMDTKWKPRASFPSLKKQSNTSLVWLTKWILWFRPFRTLPGIQPGELSSRTRQAVPRTQAGTQETPYLSTSPAQDASGRDAGLFQAHAPSPKPINSPLRQGNTPTRICVLKRKRHYSEWTKATQTCGSEVLEPKPPATFRAPLTTWQAHRAFLVPVPAADTKSHSTSAVCAGRQHSRGCATGSPPPGEPSQVGRRALLSPSACPLHPPCPRTAASTPQPTSHKAQPTSASPAWAQTSSCAPWLHLQAHQPPGPPGAAKAWSSSANTHDCYNMAQQKKIEYKLC